MFWYHCYLCSVYGRGRWQITTRNFTNLKNKSTADAIYSTQISEAIGQYKSKKLCSPRRQDFRRRLYRSSPQANLHL